MRTLLLFSLILGACSPGSQFSESKDFDGQEAMRWAAWQVSLGPRIPGSEARAMAADGITARLVELGWVVDRQDFSSQGVELENVLAHRGEAPRDGILLGAHYDTRPLADRDPVDSLRPVPGANDGASGAAVLLEVARVLSARDSRIPVWLVFFDGEDSGSIAGWDWVLGSREFVARMTMSLRAAVIVDMVGDADLQIYWERNSDPEISAAIWRQASDLGYASFIPEGRHSLLDDHTPFLQAGIRAVDIIDFDYPYWHTAQDTLDKISATSLEQVGRTLLAWLEAEGRRTP